jgi:hypothetical protein
VNGRTTVSFAVSDEHSPIQKVECSLDGILWRTVFPADGMADSREERYQVELDEELGARGLSVRAIDALNNTTTIQVDPPRTR